MGADYDREFAGLYRRCDIPALAMDVGCCFRTYTRAWDRVVTAA
jgi:hypothetical protein